MQNSVKYNLPPVWYEREFVIAWSGGKDSMASLLIALESGLKVAGVYTVDMRYNAETPATIPEHADFVENAIATVKSRYGIEIERLKCKTAFEVASEIYSERVKPGNESKIGTVKGALEFGRGRCGFTRRKMTAAETYRRKYKTCVDVIGIAADEKRRLQRLEGQKVSLLAELNLTEADCANICRKCGLLSPIYDLGYKRDGCFFCPNVSAEQIALISKKAECVQKICKLFDLCSTPAHYMAKMQNNNWFKFWVEQKCKERGWD